MATDVNINAIESSGDTIQGGLTIPSTLTPPPDQTGAKVAIQEINAVGGSPVSLEIGYRL